MADIGIGEGLQGASASCQKFAEMGRERISCREMIETARNGGNGGIGGPHGVAVRCRKRAEMGGWEGQPRVAASFRKRA